TMDEKDLKTSPKQRFFIILIAVLMLGSIVASYALIIANGGKTGSSTSTSEESAVDEEKIAELEAAYNKKEEEFTKATKDDYNEFVEYRSRVKAYNETTANTSGLQTEDIKKGSGDKLGEGDYDYFAYYIGWCADGSVFDSSFDNSENPTGFSRALDASLGMIEGWNAGVVGMRIGGIREITIPGELAYGDSTEICGGHDKPLKFLVMTKAKEDPLLSLSSELDTAYMRLQYAYYGLDYDSIEEE
ncbi:FKBP-type peptidyl-prolyl cis-trans isomerase, partial [Candidatus Saccharibacteria bacterium]|nr:FKBP-type peptidyl-prolyl cis-trans isomerase [Candidatus Saccharibacteria bacterium]